MLTRTVDAFAYRFAAMASPCEVLIDSDDEALAMKLGVLAEIEAKRIEAKFSRYRVDSVIGVINTNAGSRIVVDDETANLLDYAAMCHQLSGGLFDITSGALRRIWRFDGSDNVPTPDAVRDVLRNVGWGKVQWRRPDLFIASGMEIDFGGIGKEYAVDTAARMLGETSDAPALVNFGGDLRATRPRFGARSWCAAIESSGHSWGKRRCARVCRWRDCDKRRRAPISSEGWCSLRPYPGSTDRMAGGVAASLRHGCGADLHTSRALVDFGDASRRERGAISAR